MPLSKNSLQILDLLAREIDRNRIVVDDKSTYLGYKEVHDLLGWKKAQDVRTWGDSLNDLGLGELAIWARDNKLPAITGLVISKKVKDDERRFVPGGRYFTINGKDKSDFVWWERQVADAIARHDWHQWTEDLRTVETKVRSVVESDIPLHALEGDEYFFEGLIQERMINRRIRDQRLIQAARRHFKAKFDWRCFGCAWVPPQELDADILELHHIRAISSYESQGEKIKVAEALENLGPVCPTCHRIIHSPKKGQLSLNMARELIR
ncbi:MAG: HNH endonuclease [Proteobacteria bacterium]|nr:HNH endonuclease [Pseudomonadota bacterium]